MTFTDITVSLAGSERDRLHSSDAKAGFGIGKSTLGRTQAMFFFSLFHKSGGVSSHLKWLLKIPDFPVLLH